MTENMNFINLFLQADIIVKIIIAILLLFSVFSWAVIFNRNLALSKAKKEIKNFETKFWSGEDLNKIYTYSDNHKGQILGLEQIFYSAYKTFLRNREEPQNLKSNERIIKNTARASSIALNKELDDLEGNLSSLATIATLSPYIGLFGTVWGIMNTFIALGAVKQASLQLVAPGIAEALIATAIGLFAAIPALMGYNRLSAKFSKIEQTYDNFSEELLLILDRQAMIDNNANKNL